MAHEWSDDYRQLVDRNLGLLTEDQQELLRSSKVAVFGVGGLGGTIFELLVRCGITRFSIVDRDVFEPSNMNRQIFACLDTLGQRKIDAAEARARAINPEVAIDKRDRVGPDNIADILAGAVVGVMGIDKLEPCLVISRAAREMGIPLVEGWALPFGNVRVISSETPSLEEMYGLGTEGRPLESIGDEEFDRLGYDVLASLGKVEGIADYYSEEAMRRIATGWIPSFGPIVWLTAVLMALETVKVILNWGDTALGPAFALYDPFRHRVPPATQTPPD